MFLFYLYCFYRMFICGTTRVRVATGRRLRGRALRGSRPYSDDAYYEKKEIQQRMKWIAHFYNQSVIDQAVNKVRLPEYFVCIVTYSAYLVIYVVKAYAIIYI